MIRNERQYRMTQKQRAALAEELTSLLDSGTAAKIDNESAVSPLVLDLQRASLEGQIADLDAQLLEYEQLQAGQVARATAATLSEIPEALIKARIAAGLTQRDLAERLGMKEQQIQRYEAELYASASLARLEEVRRALDVELVAGVELPSSDKPLSSLRKRLRSLGFDRATIENRFLRDVNVKTGTGKTLAIAERVARVLGVTTDALLSENVALPAFASTARFKAPRNAAEAKLQAYARYAEGIARIIVLATKHLGPPQEIPDAQHFRAAIDQIIQTQRSKNERSANGTPTSDELFKASLRFLASLGVPVLALRDPGAFHGACFTVDDRSVIVLKQTTDSTARWLTDLLHEAGHLGDPNRGEARSWVERGEIGQWSEDPSERVANDFAADILFEGRAGHVVAQCKTFAKGSVSRLKAAVPAISERAEVAPDILSGYLAFQLSAEGINWWGAAASFQESAMPWRTTVDELLTMLDFSALDQVARAALMDALAS